MSSEDFTKPVYVAVEGYKPRSMKDLLDTTVKIDASDLHIKVGEPPKFRKGADLLPYSAAAKLEDQQDREPFLSITADVAQKLIYSMFKPEHKEIFEREKELDLSIETEKARFRVNVGKETKGIYATIRVIPYKIREIVELGFPNDIWKDIVEERQGLVLVTGETSSGKSTTVASLIQEITRHKHKKIICIEDPIEYAFREGLSSVVQREVGIDAKSFYAGVKYSLRQDPDIIFVGEIRDTDTAQEALRASETGHLVFSTLHTKDIVGTIGRYIDLFPTDRQNEIRHLLSENLKYVLSQQLIPKAKGTDRVLAMEIMVGVPAIKNLIRENKTEQVVGTIQTRSKDKMITMEGHLEMLCIEGKITTEMAMQYSRDKKDMERRLEKMRGK